MESIEQLRRDTRPLIGLGSASVATNEPLGSLLSRLADKNIPLFVQRPPESRVYCVTQSGSGYYQESILAPSKASWSNFGSNLARNPSIAEASHFSHLVLGASDYFDILAGDVTLSIKFFSQAAAYSNDEFNINIVSSTHYFRENKTGSQFHQNIKARFACYMQDGPEREGWPGMFNLMTVRVNSEKLLVSRSALLDLIDREEKPDKLPPELTEHLQPWKSDFLIALNIAAYELYSKLSKIETRNSKKKPQDIQESIKKQLPRNSQTSSKISTAAPLLRHDLNHSNAKNYLKKKEIKPYPHYFSHSLMYLNEKSKEYHDAYITLRDRHPVYIRDIIKEFETDKVVPGNTVKRIANVVKPNYEEITRHGE